MNKSYIVSVVIDAEIAVEAESEAEAAELAQDLARSGDFGSIGSVEVDAVDEDEYATADEEDEDE